MLRMDNHLRDRIIDRFPLLIKSDNLRLGQLLDVDLLLFRNMKLRHLRDFPMFPSLFTRPRSLKLPDFPHIFLLISHRKRLTFLINTLSNLINRHTINTAKASNRIFTTKAFMIDFETFGFVVFYAWSHELLACFDAFYALLVAGEGVEGC